MPGIRRALSAALCLALASTASAFDITIDYGGGTFFSTHTAARLALEAAAADVSAIITSTLGSTTSHFEAQHNGSNGYLDTSYRYNNPNGAGVITYGPTVLNANQFVLFAGVENIAGTPIGVGGPNAIAVSAGSTGFNSTANFDAAVDAAAALASANLARGAGPTIGSLSLNFAPDYPSVGFTFTYGLGLGSITFDTDTDNAGGADSETTLNNFWHFDHTTAVHPDKFDFYSVALHEIIHAVGFGSSLTWDSLRSGDDWLGGNVVSLLGTGFNVLNPGFDHVNQGLNSTNLLTGESQKPVMVPSLANGQRRFITRLDAAFLSDLNWELATLTGDANNDGVVDAADFLAVEQSFGTVSLADGWQWGDANDDGRVDGEDLLAVERYFGSTFAVPIPEPASIAIIIVPVLVTLRRWNRS